MARRPAKTAPKTRLEEARARMYRDLVEEAAEHVFAQKGFDDATMQEIAAEAGVSLKTLYATVPGKHELYEAVVEARGMSSSRRRPTRWRPTRAPGCWRPWRRPYGPT